MLDAALENLSSERIDMRVRNSPRETEQAIALRREYHRVIRAVCDEQGIGPRALWLGALTAGVRGVSEASFRNYTCGRSLPRTYDAHYALRDALFERSAWDHQRIVAAKAVFDDIYRQYRAFVSENYYV